MQDKTSNEKFLFHRQAGGDAHVLNCFPNTYEVGMASLGYQTVFKLFASNPKTHTTRYFTDFHEPHSKDLDLLTFSISWELDFFNVIKILKELNIPLRSKDRDESHPLIFAGGPVVTANPEPWADFFDLIAIGDGEENIPKLIDGIETYKEGLEKSRNKALECFLEIPGLYIPQLADKGLQKNIERQKTPKENLSATTVIAPDSCWKDVYLLEVVRSCPEMCRFCLASYLTLPFRAPDIEANLIPKVKEALQHSNNLGLLGASVTQHPEFMDLLKFLAETKKTSHPELKVQVASVRASTVSKEMTDLLKELGVNSLTIAIESGSQRLRDIINKKLPEEYIFSAAQFARESGLNAIKLYGMVGLPHETDEDVDLTIDLLTRLKAENKQLKITWGCSIFTPKAQTPFQNYGVDKDSEKKLQKLTKALKPKGIDVRPESFKWAQVQALISRGDRSINNVMIRVFQSGQTGFNVYKKMMEKSEYNHFVFDNWETEKYPWDILMNEKQTKVLLQGLEDAQVLASN